MLASSRLEKIRSIILELYDDSVVNSVIVALSVVQELEAPVIREKGQGAQRRVTVNDYAKRMTGRGSPASEANC